MAAEAHYVSVGFVEDDGTRFSVIRDRDRGLNMEVDNIIEKLCKTQQRQLRRWRR